MKKHTFAAALCGLLTLTSTHLSAQEVDDKYVENDVVSLAGKKGFSFSTKAGDFLFKPYALVQASACLNRYDDLGLETPYADNIANTGFAIPNAILGFTGKAFGSAYVTMNSKAIGADMVYAWPEAEIGMMAADMAAKIMYTDADADTLKAKTEEYKALQSSPLSAAGRGYVDTIIEPADTRKYVIGAFEMLFTKSEDRPAKKHGTV